MRSRRVTIRTGIVAKNYVSNSRLRGIIEGIGNKMRKGKYYNDLIQILEEIEINYKYKNSTIFFLYSFLRLF